MITTYTLGELIAQIDAYFRVRFPDKDLGSESWLGKQCRAIAMALLSIQKAIEDADHDALPTSNSSKAALDLFAVIFGLPSNRGGYGRNGPVAASGGAGPVTATNGAVIANGLLLLASDGVTQFALSGSVTIPGVPPGSGSIAGKFLAVTPGIAGNLDAGSVLTWISPPAGLGSTVALTSALDGGLDEESDSDLLARIYDRLQRPPKGGASIDYRTWAIAGSANVVPYIYPLRAGTGTVVLVLLLAGGQELGRIPSVDVQTAVDAYIAVVRPVTVEGYKSLVPSTSTGLTLRARLKAASKKYNWDWDDTAAAYKVAAFTPGSPATLQLNNPAPASLQAAIAAGLNPRLFVEATGGPIIPVQAEVTAYNPGSFVLTLENPLPAGWHDPSVNNVVHAGGPLMLPIATALRAYVNGLGPSRADGFADPDRSWEDTCAVARLIDTALEVKDTDGTRLASNLAVAGGMTINGAALDVQGAADIAGSPEMLFAALIVVTQ